MAKIYGLDFGTTNSLASIVLDGKLISLVNEDDQLPHPSVVKYHGNEVVVGREAKQSIETTDVGVVGDYVRSPKRYLGSGQKIHVGGIGRDVSDVVSQILRHVRDDARHRNLAGQSFDQAVVTIPVNSFGRSRQDLREAALKAGIHIHQYIQEPFAALYGYMRSLPDYKRRLAELDGQLVLVFDWGGGTLDLTLCKISQGMLIQIQSIGDNTVGGDRFDDRIIQYAKKQHIEEYGLDDISNEFPHAESKLLGQCEMAKIALSDRPRSTIAVAHYLRSEGPEETLAVSLSREKLNEITKDIVDAGMRNIDRLLESTQVNEASISLCISTGGMVRMPYIRERLLERFDAARVPKIDKGDQIISHGAAWIAHDGVKLQLAKPIEILLGDDNYSTLISNGIDLPTENQNYVFSSEMYCTDPRDGYGKFEFARPVWPGRSLPGDPRNTYATLMVAVDIRAAPLTERLKVGVTIDHDLIATVSAESTMVGHSSEMEIHNLEFGLPITNEKKKTSLKSGLLPRKVKQSIKVGKIKLRSNIVMRDDAWNLVPGELTSKYRSLLPANWEKSKKQHDEDMYYVPCSYCKRTWYQIQLEGSENCKCKYGSVKESEAKLLKESVDRTIHSLLQKENEINQSEFCIKKGTSIKGIQ